MRKKWKEGENKGKKGKEEGERRTGRMKWDRMGWHIGKVEESA